MKFEQLTIDSKFLYVTPNDYAVVAKFAIIVNGHSFEYSQSAYWLSQQYKKLKGFYSQQGSGWIIQEVVQSKSCITKSTNDSSSFSVDISNNRSYYVDLTDAHWTSFFADLSRLKLTLTDEEQLFALRCVLQDALLPLEFSEEEFIECMDYEGDYQSVMKGVRCYNQCKDTFFKLALGDSQIYTLLDKLSEQGIE